MSTSKLIKNLLIVGLITTVKIAADFLIEKPDDDEKEIIELGKTDLSEILSDIRSEMHNEMDKLPENQRMLRNYVRGRIATIDDIEKRLI